MVRNLKGKSDTTIKFITEKIKKSMREEKNSSKRKIKKRYSSGEISLKDRKNILLGLTAIQRIEQELLALEENNLREGKKDVSYQRKEIFQYKFIIDSIINRIKSQARMKYNLEKDIETLEDYVKIAQASRDGIILKQAKRQEKIKDKIEEVTCDIPMTPQEVIATLRDYQEFSERIQFEKLNNYIRIRIRISWYCRIID